MHPSSGKLLSCDSTPTTFPTHPPPISPTTHANPRHTTHHPTNFPRYLPSICLNHNIPPSWQAEVIKHKKTHTVSWATSLPWSKKVLTAPRNPVPKTTVNATAPVDIIRVMLTNNEKEFSAEQGAIALHIITLGSPIAQAQGNVSTYNDKRKAHTLIFDIPEATLEFKASLYGIPSYDKSALPVVTLENGDHCFVELIKSSGHASLDAAARNTVSSRWRFHPARRGGVAVPAVVTVPIRFELR